MPAKPNNPKEAWRFFRSSFHKLSWGGMWCETDDDLLCFSHHRHSGDDHRRVSWFLLDHLLLHLLLGGSVCNDCLQELFNYDED